MFPWDRSAPSGGFFFHGENFHTQVLPSYRKQNFSREILPWSFMFSWKKSFSPRAFTNKRKFPTVSILIPWGTLPQENSTAGYHVPLGTRVLPREFLQNGEVSQGKVFSFPWESW